MTFFRRGWWISFPLLCNESPWLISFSITVNGLGLCGEESGTVWLGLCSGSHRTKPRCWLGSLSTGGSVEKYVSTLMAVVGRTQFLEAVGLTSLLPSSLSAGGYTHLPQFAHSLWLPPSSSQQWHEKAFSYFESVTHVSSQRKLSIFKKLIWLGKVHSVHLPVLKTLIPPPKSLHRESQISVWLSNWEKTCVCPRSSLRSLPTTDGWERKCLSEEFPFEVR